MKFSRQEYWSGLPFPSPGDLPDPGNEPEFALQVDALPSEPLLSPTMVKATHLDAEAEPWEDSGHRAKLGVAGTR